MGVPRKRNDTAYARYVNNGGRIVAIRIPPEMAREFEKRTVKRGLTATAYIKAALYWYMKKEALKETEGKPVKTLSAWCKEADECNLDYGAYRTLVELHGKTFEELKAQAGTRCLPTHSRIHAVNKI